MENISLDAGDIRIMKVLQQEADISIAEIAKRAGMSQTPCWRRVKRLKEAGVIKRVVAIIDREAVGLGFVAYASVKLALPNLTNMTEFDRLVNSWAEVVSCERVTGAIDYLLKVVVPDIAAYDAVYKRLVSEIEIEDVSSAFAMERIKDTQELPLEYLMLEKG